MHHASLVLCMAYTLFQQSLPATVHMGHAYQATCNYIQGRVEDRVFSSGCINCLDFCVSVGR